MTEETSINFKALRAKFQEEALIAESRASRPAVAEKPRVKHLPPAGGHCSSVLSTIHMAVEHKTSVVPRVFFRDGLRASGGKRPISFPPHSQLSHSSQTGDSDAPFRPFLKDRQMPLVLPVLPKEPKSEPGFGKEHKPEVDDLLQTKTRIKGLLVPFKPTRSAKASSEHGEEPTYADLTCRPASAPGELPSVERLNTDDRLSLQGSEHMCEGTLSSPDITISPPSADTRADSDSRVFSTLERAKKKFSRRHMMSSKPKSSSPDRGSKSRVQTSPTNGIHCTDLPAPPPIPAQLNLPNLIYISARPFCKGTTIFKSPLEKHYSKDKINRPFARVCEPRPSSPQKKPLPELWALGPQPKKPLRPPVVDLTIHTTQIIQDSLLGVHQASPQEADVNHAASASVIDAPYFPDFEISSEISEIETAESEVVDIAALDLEALDLPALDDNSPSHSDCFPVNLSKSCGPLEQWTQSEVAAVDPTSCTKDPANPQSIPEDQGDVNFEVGIYQQDLCPTACDNVYEDVENLSKISFNQNSRKWKGLKNPYADNNQLKEGSGYNTWQKTSRRAGDSGYLSHSQINSKECQSPNSAEFKEQKKREKQRLEREKKEQKEREKRENEMRKKFKVTGQEEPLYHAKVTVANKVRKNDLPVKSGDTVGIIRTNNCPKGKWLARDASHKYGYISVMNVELNIKEMLELGKKAQAAGRGGNMDADTISNGSSSHPAMMSSCEFTDDSEEWACEDETLSPSNESLSFTQQSAPPPETSGGHVSAQHTLSDASLEELHTQTRHEALQKLAVFFQHNKEEVNESGVALIDDTSLETPNLCDVEEPPLPEQEIDFTEMEFLPPPPLYADIF